MTKPFSPRELVARLRVMLRRPRADPAAEPAGRAFGDLLVHPEAREVRLAGELVDLTRTEFDLLDVLSANPRRVFPRRALIAEVWGSDWYGDEHIVDVHIAHLRTKLRDDASNSRYVITVRGVGYRMGTG
jgi:DNA-binding response OmpR family regulator